SAAEIERGRRRSWREHERRESSRSRLCSFPGGGAADGPASEAPKPGSRPARHLVVPVHVDRPLRPGSSHPPSGRSYRVSGGRVCMTSAMRVCWSLGTAAAVLFALPGAAHGQRDTERPRYRWLGMHDVTLQAYVGVSVHGRFLLQALDFDLVDFGLEGITPQRKLTAERAFSWGLAVGARDLPRTHARLAFNWTRPDLEFEDDTGLDLDLFDNDDIGELTSTTLALELIRYILPEWRRFNVYAGAGILVTWWNLDDREFSLIVDDTIIRGGI